MAGTFVFGIYTPQQLADAGTARSLWRLLDDPLVGPTKFDSVERAKRSFTSAGAEEASQLYRDEGLLFVRGSGDRFVASFTRIPEGWSRWNIWLDLRAMQGRKLQPWLAWFHRLCSGLPAYFAYGCSQDEYDAKHEVVKQYPGGATSTSAVGMSEQEFHQYLPGLYWLTVFGDELARGLGRSKIESLTNVEVEELKNGQFAIRLQEPVVPEDIERRLDTERRIADILGPQFFFDRSRPDIKFQPVPALLKSLDELKRT